MKWSIFPRKTGSTFAFDALASAAPRPGPQAARTGPIPRAGRALGLAFVLLALPAAGQERLPAPGPGKTPAACVGNTMPDRLERLTPEGDLVLASGGLARLSAIRLPDRPPARDRALGLLNGRIGRPLLVESSGVRDRWGRLSVRIRPDGDAARDAAAPDLAGELVGAGLAVVDPGPSGPFCRPDLLGLEDAARKLNLGLWADALYKPIEAEQTGRLQDRFGTFTLVEGRVRTVGERTQRTYLNFGRHWTEDFTIIVPKRTWKLMAQRGLDAAALKGRRIRARGILESWRGAALTVVVPEMIEDLERTPPSR